MLLVHGLPGSTCTSRVIVCFLQLGLVPNKDFKVVPIDRDAMKVEPYLNHQPFGQMPYLVDQENGLELFESRAICKYAAAKITSPLLPLPEKGLSEFSAFETACSMEQADFDPWASAIWVELVLKKRRGMESDLSAVKAHKATLAKKLEGYERVLSKHRYIGGEKMTLADLFHLPYGTKVVELDEAPGMVDGTFPNLSRWWKELSGLENWVKRDELIGAN